MAEGTSEALAAESLREPDPEGIAGEKVMLLRIAQDWRM